MGMFYSLYDADGDEWQTKAYGRSLEHFETGVLFLHGRLYFHHADGTRAAANSGAPSCLVAYGERAAEKLMTAPLSGTYVPLPNRQIRPEEDEFSPGECDGSGTCPAPVHIHGCYTPHRSDECESPDEYGHTDRQIGTDRVSAAAWFEYCESEATNRQDGGNHG